MITRPKQVRTLLVAAVLAAGCVAAENATPAARDVPQYTIEDFMSNKEIFGSSLSPDRSKILISSNSTGIYNAFAIPVTGGEPVQLTRSEESVFVADYFPNDERFLYSSDKGGNELSHVYVQSPDGSVKDLTPGDKHTASFAGWAHDLESFFITTNERNPQYFDLYEYAVDGYARKLVYQNKDGLDVGAISRDKRYIALVKPITTNNSDLYLYDTQTSQTKHLTPHQGDVNNSPNAFSPDGKSLYFTTDEGSEYAYLVKYDLATGQRTDVLKPNWDIWGAGFSHNGKYLTVTTNEDAVTKMVIYDAATMQPVQLSLPAGNIENARISRDESKLIFYLGTDRSPADLYVHDLASKETKQLTTNLNPAIDHQNLVDATVVRFKSYDGVEVPGLLYKPHQASADRKAPALVWVHGGPGGQSRVGYFSLIQYLVNHGYVIYAINNRGSSGYGKTFFKMDDKKHGEADLDDCVAAKQMLINTGYVDPAKVGIIGGSYGGYMVLAALAFRPDTFAVGVDLFGVANWIRTLESIPPYWESFKQALYVEMGDPTKDREYLDRISPLFHPEGIKKPLMVLQGANDPRVLKVESDEIVAAVKKNGVPVEYVIFDDEGHGFVKKANELRGYKAVLDFLDRHLKGITTVAER